MGRQLRVQRPPIRNISGLRDRCLNIWYNLSPVIYQGLVASMPRRVEAVLSAKEHRSLYNCAGNVLQMATKFHSESNSLLNCVAGDSDINIPSLSSRNVFTGH
ncbi:transposase domain containing protein [Nephila pilipes]|uniref:Transposase domain containing protein n=1 Tax=Nephila pilipes TaxID=299642 RepID=A0A8X6P2L5_NEPPI|nr:transposase domain containing protein [Nephila pilipes]